MPVGAASAISGQADPAAAACSANSATIRATVVVLPVPGPPATTANRRSTAEAAARHCRAAGLAREQPRQPFGQQLDPHAGIVALAHRTQIERQLALLAPVAIEVQRATEQPQRTSVR